MNAVELNAIPIYIGDSSDLAQRIFNNHCRGNVEASVLRKYIAIEMKFELDIRKRISGSRRVRIKSSVNGEELISSYISSGTWKYVTCESRDEASDFQWYAIDIIKPLLNRKTKEWKRNNIERYESLLNKLINQLSIKCEDTYMKKTLHKPGVYLLIHKTIPKDFYLNIT